MPVQQLDGGVDVEYPVGVQGFVCTLAERRFHPSGTLRQLGRTGGPFFFTATFGEENWINLPSRDCAGMTPLQAGAPAAALPLENDRYHR